MAYHWLAVYGYVNQIAERFTTRVDHRGKRRLFFLFPLAARIMTISRKILDEKIKFISSAGYEHRRRPQGRVQFLPFGYPIGVVPAVSGGELRVNAARGKLAEYRTAECAGLLFGIYATMSNYGQLLKEKFPNLQEAYDLKQVQKCREC